MSTTTGHEAVRPAWTYQNAGRFLYWMRTGAAELPEDWADPEDETNSNRQAKP